MKNILVILKHNLKSIMKGWFLLILVFPIVVNLFLNVLIKKVDDNNNEMNNTFDIVVYSNDKSEIMNKILPKEKFSKVINVNNKEDVKKTLDKEDVSVGVVINSKNIYDDIKKNKKDIIEVISSEDDNSKEYVLSALNASINQILAFGNNMEEYNKAYDKYEKDKYEFIYEDTKLEAVIPYMIMFGLFTMAFLFIAGRGINPLLKEKELKIDKRILVSKVSKVEYALGHILGCFILLLLQSITLVASFYFFNPDFNVNFFYMILLSVVLSVVGIAIALIVLSISNSSSMYYTLLSMIITPMCLLSGGFVPTNFMPQMVQNFSLVLPLTWVNSAFNQILNNGSNSKIFMDLLVAMSISVVLIMIYLVVEKNKKNKMSY
ncbi:ABC transporter permease [Terrisporobacter mayombei]|uniref:Linearmycin resistance permease protein LnrM n=1 Tax=Terrisporobacter mayombei TaxID=1541 RepID=A0ABY9PYE6_9FIRM|nr:ABC transporter permease [Terrisporobacter mayombei]MCC3868122.1 ABC transporter permease [Terrisporobacter mayombei]WMT80263.1 Linearmycin resistance permease protein LnrM [Terrisporobacter mayombei]